MFIFNFIYLVKKAYFEKDEQVMTISNVFAIFVITKDIYINISSHL